jgi:serine protease Do
MVIQMRARSVTRLVALVLVSAVALVACGRSVTDAMNAPDQASTSSNDVVNTALPTQVDPTFDPSQDRVVQVIERVLPAVVNVTTDAFTTTGGGIEPSRGTGTGFVIREDGVIVTNCHVVEGANKITVQTPEIGDIEPQEFEARVIGHDCDKDLAVIKVDTSGLPTVSLGKSSELRLGEQVIALGYPLRLEGGPSVTSGIVSALDRTIEVNDPNFGNREYTDIIQTDAAINPGNSGGPLVDLDGNVVGINSAGVTADAAENIGFAISIDSALATIQHAIADPAAPVAYLGVVSDDVTASLVLQLDLPVEQGAYIIDVSPDGPAEGAGVEAGDVIVRFDGDEVTGQEQLGELIRDHAPGDEVEVVVVKPSGATEAYTIELGLNPGPVLG